jgi:hypothetical protein
MKKMESIYPARRYAVIPKLCHEEHGIDVVMQGISLTIDQYKALLRAIPDINAHLADEGVDVKASAMSEDEAEETSKPAKRVKAKKEKPNFVATSDEEEDD